jgi:WD40 repeat protein
MTRALFTFGFVVVSVCANATTAAPPITAIAVSSDGGSIVIGSQAGVEVLNYPTLKHKRSLTTKLLHIHDLALSPDGKTLAVAGGIPAESGEVELFSWPDGKLLTRHNSHDDLILGVAWSHDSKQWASASLDQSVHHHGGKAYHLKGHSRGVRAVAFLGDSSHLVSAGIDNSLRVWELEEGKLRRTLDNHKAPIVDLALRPAHDGLPMIASASEDKTIRFWQPTIGRLVRFALLPSAPLAIAWTPDGTRLCASCRDGHVRVIDPDTVEIIADLPAIDGWAYSLAVLPDGNHIVVGGEGGQVKALSVHDDK